MDGAVLAGSGIHGFRTMKDLEVSSMMEEAKARWLRPNEIHAILCNYNHFPVNMKPLNLPKSGTIVLFDRKMLRNFRKDGYNWKKKKDGKTVKEAHEHLKVGNEERIHVYYAHGEDSPTFVRRCYWLLDKTLDHIVLVHYRETQELQGSPVTLVNSNSSSAQSDPSGSWNLSEDTDSGVDQVDYASGKPHLETNEIIKNHEMRLHEINTLEWDELVVPDDPNKLITLDEGNSSCYSQPNQGETNGRTSDVLVENGEYLQDNSTLAHSDALDIMDNDGLWTQDSFGRWMNYVITDSPGTVDDLVPSPESSISTGQESNKTPLIDPHQSLLPEKIFSIIDISPGWALLNEETKILVVGFFHEEHAHLAKTMLYFVCGDVSVPAEFVQSGVYRCLIYPHNPGLVNLYLSFDGHKPISQVVPFEYRSPMQHQIIPSELRSDWEQLQIQMRLAHLLFSSSKSLNILHSKASQKTMNEAKLFVHKTSHIIESWTYLIKSIGETKISFPQAKESLFELTLQNRFHEWLLEIVVEGSKVSDCDGEGQGVIHLCAILGYTWAVYPFSCSGLSMDFRDKFGWTALHWAAYYGREKMVATLLSAGAKPNLVTDPTSENPGGSTAADLASKSGHDGLAGYLAEKALVAHFKDMTIAGNVSGSLQGNLSSTDESITSPVGVQISEDELSLKDTLIAYRTAADAAARIQAAFREHSFNLRRKAVQMSNPEDEARCIIAAMKIQHAYRNHESRKKMTAAAHIQYRFRTWKMRKHFLNLRRHAIKIQAVFRGFQVRRQHRKIVWSVGVLEKAILRWRFKRKGFRGHQVSIKEASQDEKQQIGGEEDFFYASRKQAEERVERSVVRVQAMFRSKRAQEDYRRMKMVYSQATLEYEGLLNPVTDME